MISLEDHLSNLEAMRDMIDEMISDARSLRVSGVSARHASGAMSMTDFIRENPDRPLRNGAHLPKMSLEECVENARFVMSSGEWVAPAIWASNHYKNGEVAACWKDRMRRGCVELVARGQAERRNCQRLGARHEYRLL